MNRFAVVGCLVTLLCVVACDAGSDAPADVPPSPADLVDTTDSASSTDLSDVGNVVDTTVFRDVSPAVNEPCPEGLTRDQLAGSETYAECIPILEMCAECLFHWQCGQDAQCIVTGAGLQFCMPKCVPGECPDWASCERTDDTGLRACVPDDVYCCGDAETCPVECHPACEEPAPYCNPDTRACVECLENAHCPARDAACDPATHTCGEACSALGLTPYEWEGDCVACVLDWHCGTGVCDTETHTCSGGDPCGGACEYPYPGCAIINGVPSCVPCTEDAHCIDCGTCDMDTFLCTFGGCGYGCAQDCLIQGCPTDSPHFDIRCDPHSGCCYDAGGLCDDETAFCNEAGNSECVPLSEIWVAGVPSGLYPEGFDGGTCSCDSASSQLCNLIPDNPVCEDAALCYEGMSCAPLQVFLDARGIMGMDDLLPSGDFCGAAESMTGE